jgi:hypothetical protein
MAIIETQIKWADNTSELSANLKSGLDQIEAMKSSADRLTASLGGDGLFKAANNLVAAISQLGDTTKLTAAEQDKASATLDAAIAKYTAMGQSVPSDMQRLADSFHQADSAWGDFVSDFDPEKAISDPIGTAKDAMSAFAETLGPTAVAAAAAGGAIVALGAAVLTLVEHAATVGGSLSDMAEKTGESVPWLSRLSDAATVAGSDLDLLTNATFKLEQGLGDGSAKVADGLSKIGLSTDVLKAAGPDQYMTLLAQAFAATADPSTRAAAAMDLFGRSGRDIVPTLLSLNDALLATNDIQPWTAEQAAAAKAFDMQIVSLAVHAKALAVEFGSDLIAPVSSLIGAFNDAKTAFNSLPVAVQALLTPAAALGQAFGYASAAVDTFTGSTNAVAPSLDDAAKKQALLNAAFDAAHTPDADVKAFNDQVKDLALNVPTLDDAWLADKEVMRDLDPIIKELGQAYEAIKYAGDGWQGTLDTIDGSVVEAMRDYAAAGVPLKDLEVLYGLTATQGKAFSDMLKDQAQQTKLNTAADLELEKLQDAYAAADVARSGTTNDIETANINKTYSNLWNSLVETGKMSDELSVQLDKNWGQALSGVGDFTAAVNKVSFAQLITNYENAVAQYQYAFGKVPQDQLQAFKDKVDAAAAALHPLADNATAAAKGATALATATASVSLSTQSAINAFMGINQVLGASDEAAAAIEGDMNSAAKSVLTLAGAYVTAKQAKDAFDMGNSVTYDLTTDEGMQAFMAMNPGASISWSDAQIEAFTKNGGTLQQLEQMGVINVYAGLENDPLMPHYATGVVNAPGSWALVGENGPEIVNLPQGSNVYPNGMGPLGGGGDTYNINIYGSLGTMAQLTDAVSKGIFQSIGRKVTKR